MVAVSRIMSVLVPLALTLWLTRALAEPVAPGHLPSAATEQLDRRLAGGPWKVVVLGNSTANMALREGPLGRFLGAPGHAVKAYLPGTSPLTWYSILKHRVYGRAQRPPVVIVAAPSHAFLVTRPEPGIDSCALMEIAGTGDPVVERHLWASGVRGPLQTMDTRRRSWHTTAIETLAQSAIAVAREPDQQEVRDLFLEGVHQENPLLGAVAAMGDDLDDVVLDPEASVLPDLLELVRANGGLLVLAATPTQLTESQDPGHEARDRILHEWAARNGVLYLTFRRLEFTRADFLDTWHLSNLGAARFTEALGRTTRAWRSRQLELARR